MLPAYFMYFARYDLRQADGRGYDGGRGLRKTSSPAVSQFMLHNWQSMGGTGHISTDHETV